MSGLPIEFANGQNLDGDANNNAKVNLPLTMSQAGYVRITGRDAIGSVRVDANSGRMAVEQDTLLFTDVFNAALQNTSIWRYAFTTMTTTQTGFLTLNANGALTANIGTNYSTWQVFPWRPDADDSLQFSIMPLNAFPQTGQHFCFGKFNFTTAPGTTEIQDGVFVELASSGLTGYMVQGGSQIANTPLMVPIEDLTLGTLMRLEVNATSNEVVFRLNGVRIGVMAVPGGVSAYTQWAAQPLSMYVRQTAAITGVSCQVRVFDCAVVQRGFVVGITPESLASGQGRAGAVLQNGSATYGQNSNLVNNLAAGAGAALANTTTANTQLNGRFAVLPTLTAGTDGIVNSFAVPAGGINVTPRGLKVYGVWVQGVVTTLLANTGPVIYEYTVCFGHTAISLGTAQSASFATNTTKAPVRVHVGLETYAINAPVGTLGSDGLYVPFRVPLQVNPGEFIALAAKNLGTVTTAGVISVCVRFDAHYD